ncbi:MAG: site-specific DNA-methyltransferase [Bacilli bacterium]
MLHQNTTINIYEDLDSRNFSVTHGDGVKLIKHLKDKSIKLVYGSPPYPNAKRNYRTWKIENYIKEISPFIKFLIPKLTDDGFIVINVKSNRVQGTKTTSSERSLVIEELMIHMKKVLKLYCVDIEIWAKTNPVPTGVRVATIDAYEYNLWFSKSSKWVINIDQIRRPYKESSIKSYENVIYKPRQNKLQYVTKEKKIFPNPLGALPINVISGAVSGKVVNHQAVQPNYLPERYIRACTQEGDIVLDPWTGSGTTGVVALNNNRKFIGFEISEEFCQMSIHNISNRNPV